MFYVDGWNTIGVEVISVTVLVHEESHPMFTWFTLRVCVADEASEWCQFIGYGVCSERTQVIEVRVRMCSKYTS